MVMLNCLTQFWRIRGAGDACGHSFPGRQAGFAGTFRGLGLGRRCSMMIASPSPGCQRPLSTSNPTPIRFPADVPEFPAHESVNPSVDWLDAVAAPPSALAVSSRHAELAAVTGLYDVTVPVAPFIGTGFCTLITFVPAPAIDAGN